MPLASLLDSGLPGWPQVARITSTAKITAKQTQGLHCCKQALKINANFHGSRKLSAQHSRELHVL